MLLLLRVCERCLHHAPTVTSSGAHVGDISALEICSPRTT
jgi:hypothetical protein